MAFEPLDRGLLRAMATSRAVAEQAARWQERNQEQIDLALRALQGVQTSVARAPSWVYDHHDQIQAMLRGLIPFRARAAEIEAEWERAGLGYLVSPLGMAEQLLLAVHAAPGDAGELIEFLEAALADTEFVGRTCSALEEATALSGVARRHLQHGLSHLQAREPFDAWPPLIIGLEGAFVDVAVEQGIAVRVDNHVHLADPDGNPLPQKSPSVEGVARLLGHGAGETEFGEFLVRQVYGGEGDPFRHGTAREGVRDRAVCLAFAVVGWLDAFVAPGTRDLLREAVARELSRRDEETDHRT